MEPDFKAAREFIDAEHRKTHPQRLCPACNQLLELKQLRASQRWTWRHKDISECRLDRLGSAVKFLTEADAREAVIIFHKQENPVDPNQPS